LTHSTHRYSFPSDSAPAATRHKILARFQHAPKIRLNNLAQVSGDKGDNLDPVGADQLMQLTGNRSADQGFDALSPQGHNLTGGELIRQQPFATCDNPLAIGFNQMDLSRRVKHRGYALIPI
jgi:hypothetical protein